MSDLENLQCRYCLDTNDNDFGFIMPCNCSTPVHKECLIRWIYHRINNRNLNNLNCEICNSTYSLEYLAIIIEELNNPESNQFERLKHEILCYLITFIFLFIYDFWIFFNLD